MAVFSSFPGAAAISLSALLLCSAAALQGQMEGSGSYQPRFEPEDRDQWQMPDSVVAALGPGVSGLAPGDRVFGAVFVGAFGWLMPYLAQWSRFGSS